MSDFPTPSGAQGLTIMPASVESIGAAPLMINGGGTSSSSTWPSANRGIFVPFRVETPLVAVKMFTLNGNAVAGNVDVGIYDDQQNRLVSMGSTAQAGTSVAQAFDITDTLLLPGIYYMALAASSTTAQFQRWVPLVAHCSAYGVLSQSIGAVTLPNPATFAAAQDAYVPAFGLTARTVI